MFESRLTTAAGRALVLCLYPVLALLLLIPVLPRMGSEIIGPPEDNMLFYWFLWYGGRALTDPAVSLMHTRMMYFPEGMSLYYANYYYFGVFVAAALKSWISLPVLFNGLIYASFVLSGWGAYALARWVGTGRSAALIAGIVYAFNPSHIAHAEHHITIASIQFFPWMLLFYLRARAERRVLWALCASMALVANAWCDWNYWVFSVLFLAGFYGWRVLCEKRLWLGAEIRWLAWVLLPAAAVLSVWIVPMLRLSAEQAGKELYLPGQDRYVVDLLGFAIPATWHISAAWEPVRKLSASIIAESTEWEKVGYLGWVSLILVVSQWRNLGRRARPWMIAATVFYALALGSRLHVLGWVLDLPMPYQILEAMPVIKHARNPSRIMVWSYLCWSILVAMACERAVSGISGRVKRGLLLAGIGIGVTVDFICPLRQTTPVRLPAGYEKVVEARQDGEPFAVMSIPWDGGRYMFYQTLHGIPDLQGYLGRKYGTSLIGAIPFDARHLDAQKALLIRHRVKYILFHKKKREWSALRKEDWGTYTQISAQIREYARVYTKVFEDADLAIFEVY